MNYLAIDTSRNSLTVAVGGEGIPVGEERISAGRKGNSVDGKSVAISFLPDCALTHSVVLMDEIEKCLEKAGIDKKNIDVFACAVGPGSFTGIRIGVATVKALAYALGKKVLGVTSFDSLAYNVTDGRKKLAVIDARHGNFYACGYSADGKIDLTAKFIDTNELKALSKEYEVVSDVPIDGFADCVVADVKDGFVKSVEANLENASLDVETLVPLYVKKSQAEEEA